MNDVSKHFENPLYLSLCLWKILFHIYQHVLGYFFLSTWDRIFKSEQSKTVQKHVLTFINIMFQYIVMNLRGLKNKFCDLTKMLLLDFFEH